MKRRPRVLLAGLFHETNTFIPTPTRWADFDVVRGADLLSKAGDESPLAGFLEEAARRGFEVVPTIDARAVPSGTVADEAFAQFWSEFEGRARPELAAGIDGIFLVLHGAMVTPTLPDVEGEFLARLRALPGAANLPLFGVLDLHANVTARMCAHADGLVTYRQNPHIDAKQTAIRATGFLDRCLATGRRPRMTWCRVPIVWTPPGTGTDSDPMRALVDFALKTEATDPAVWACNVAAGFAFADMPETGVSLSLISDAPSEATRGHLAAGAEVAWSLRRSGMVDYPEVAEVLATIGPDPRGPVVLVEPADNIGAGAPGDGTGILRALIACDAHNALLAINDPHAVETLHPTRVGDIAHLAIGGRECAGDPGPVDLDVTLLSRSDGFFQLEDPQSHLASMSGATFAMGPSAVVRHRGITILLTSRKTPPFDLGQYHSQGLDVRSFSIVAVKAAVAHRRAYDPIAAASYFVATPGPCANRVAALNYRRLLRPVFPLDPISAPEFRFA